MRDIVYKDDYVGFTYAGIHSSQLGIKSVTSGKRYKKYLSPTSKDNTATIPGRDGMVYFGNNKSKLQFDFNIAFDDITEEEYMELYRWLDSEMGELILDEQPYIKYYAKPTGTNQIKYLVFLDDNNERVYKGEGTIKFVCYDTDGHSVSKWLNDYSNTGFNNDKNFNIESVSDSINEWAQSARLLSQKEEAFRTYDIVIDNRINVYNPGAKPTNFILTLPYMTDRLNIKLIDSDEKELDSFCLDFSYITKYKQHSAAISKIVIDTEKRVIYLDNGKDITPINNAIIYGDMFKIPIDKTMKDFHSILLETSTQLDNTNCLIDYEYLY